MRAMGIEIERKFLVTGAAWRQGEGTPYRQGYLSRDAARTVRVRVAGDAGFLTIKGATRGAVRAEFEYAIPLADAEALLRLADGDLIDKRRRHVAFGGFTWDVDEFFGANAGLVVAEIELPHADTPFPRPPWLGREVTDDGRYSNASLSAHPYRDWR